MTIAVIGSTTKDRIIIEKRGKDYSQAGGGVYYSSMTLAALGVDVIAIPLLAKEDAAMLDALTHPKISVHPIWTAETTTYWMRFPNETMDICEKKLLATATGVTWGNNIVDKTGTASAIHVSPLSPNEFDSAFYQSLRSNFKGIISLDGQGLVRGKLPDIETFLPGNIDILKCDDTEILQLTRCTTEDAAIQKAMSWGISEILVTRASRGSTVYHTRDSHTIPAHPPAEIVDATGCGDAFVAGYLYERVQGSTPLACGQFAARIAAKNIEHQGAPTSFQ
jgi:sugar/nucleoside kinase (ribokinase family)